MDTELTISDPNSDWPYFFKIL